MAKGRLSNLTYELFLLRHPDVQDIEKVSLKEEVINSIKASDMMSLFQTLSEESVLELDQEVLDSMRANIEEELKKLNEKIVDAEENLGESEVREAHLAKSELMVRVK